MQSELFGTEQPVKELSADGQVTPPEQHWLPAQNPPPGHSTVSPTTQVPPDGAGLGVGPGFTAEVQSHTFATPQPANVGSADGQMLPSEQHWLPPQRPPFGQATSSPTPHEKEHGDDGLGAGEGVGVGDGEGVGAGPGVGEPPLGQ